jgi:hypothetical protein
MIDIETLGTAHSSIFLSVAAVPFDLKTRAYKGKEFFYKTVELNSAMKAGLTIDPSTLQWWLNQKPEVMKLMFKDAQPLEEVLKDLSAYFKAKGLIYPWGNSASFDLGILTNAYQKIGLPVPWKFYNERCYRTVVSLFAQNVPKKPENAHDPVADCHYQLNRLLALPIAY